MEVSLGIEFFISKNVKRYESKQKGLTTRFEALRKEFRLFCRGANIDKKSGCRLKTARNTHPF
jgi:hypothetical protein